MKFVYDDAGRRKKVYCPFCNSFDVEDHQTVERIELDLVCRDCGRLFLQGVERYEGGKE
jgi:transposase-like protein